MSVFYGKSLSVRHPNVAMTTNTTGSYTASASSIIGTGNEAFRAFDRVVTGMWMGLTSAYAGGTNGTQYTGAVSTTVRIQGVDTAVKGDWLQLKMPGTSTIVVKRYVLGARADEFSYPRRNPTGWVLAGSTNGTTWTAVHVQAQTNWLTTPLAAPEFAVDLATNTTAYSYYRFIITNGGNTGTTDHWPTVQELQLWT